MGKSLRRLVDRQAGGPWYDWMASMLSRWGKLVLGGGSSVWIKRGRGEGGRSRAIYTKTSSNTHWLSPPSLIDHLITSQQATLRDLNGCDAHNGSPTLIFSFVDAVLKAEKPLHCLIFSPSTSQRSILSARQAPLPKKPSQCRDIEDCSHLAGAQCILVKQVALSA